MSDKMFLQLIFLSKRFLTLKTDKQLFGRMKSFSMRLELRLIIKGHST